jgi:hypothetical protein
MNRETWLNEAIDKHLVDYFDNVAYLSKRCGGHELRDIRDKIKVSCGFPAGVRGGNNKAIGVCWSQRASTGGYIEIFISPVIESSSRVLDILIHELIHAILPDGEGHGSNFRKCAIKLGLEGKMTATTCGAFLYNTLNDWITNLGEYPHASMNTGERKKQTTRMIKHQCNECGAIWRMSRRYTPSICPCCHEQYTYNGGE